MTFKKAPEEMWEFWSRGYDARSVAARAIKSKILVRSKCVICAKFGDHPEVANYKCKAVAHHPDYTKPLDVMWLCYAHHSAWHKLFIQEDRPNIKSEEL